MPNPAEPPIRNDVAAPSRTQRIPFILRYLPGLRLFRNYQRGWLAHDLVAGVSVCVVMIPSVIAYAQLMGLPPQSGLYAALVPLLIYALVGSSRQMIVGPDIAISLLIASTIGPLAGGNPGRATVLAAALALLSGLLLLLGARANFGAVADFLAKPVLIGYMTGAALILVGSQLDKLFGIALHKNDFFPRLLELAGKLHQTHPLTLVLGVSLLVLLIGLHRFLPRLPGVLIACAAAMAASTFWGLEQRGLAVVGTFPAGLPALVVPAVSWQDLQQLLPAAIGIALLTYTEGILLARAFAAKNGYEVAANQELSALGIADLATGLFQGFSITGSQARTTINDGAGARSPLSSLIAAATLCLFLIWLTPLISRLPQVALAAGLIFAGFNLVEFDVMMRIYRFYPRSGVVAGLTTISVLAAGVVPGIIFGVALSLLGLINRISRPPDAVLSAVPGHGYHDLGVTEKQTISGLIAYRFYAPLLFSNAGHFAERVRELIAKCPESVRWFLLDAQAITEIDVTAIETLHALHQELRAQGIALKIAHANRPLRDLLQQTGLAAEIGQQSFFPSVHEAIAAYEQQKRGGQPTPTSPPNLEH